MNSFITRTNKPRRAMGFFLRMQDELDLEKYKLDKYRELLTLASFQNMHDADLAYVNIYAMCAKYAVTKQGLLNCLNEEARMLTIHPEAFNQEGYRQQALKLIAEIVQQLNSGALDYLFD